MKFKSFASFIKKILRKIFRKEYRWSIGIYLGDSPFSFAAPETIKNPVLTAKDVTDVKAHIVADPFMVRENGNWYMFFEVMNDLECHGMIGLATSKDGLDWEYQQIVVKEPFHLSYPYVFKWNNHYYMIPESYKANSIRLYKAIDFPTKWSFVKTLLTGNSPVDSSIFHFNDRWWLFTGSRDNRILRLYYADDLMGVWLEHPQSPVIKDNSSIARPGGRVVVLDDRIIRYAQDCKHRYGHQVRAFEITQLTTNRYQEKEVRDYPILQANGSGWNQLGMHTVDPHQIDDGKWIACVDGQRRVLAFFGI